MYWLFHGDPYNGLPSLKPQKLGPSIFCARPATSQRCRPWGILGPNQRGDTFSTTCVFTQPFLRWGKDLEVWEMGKKVCIYDINNKYNICIWMYILFILYIYMLYIIYMCATCLLSFFAAVVLRVLKKDMVRPFRILIIDVKDNWVYPQQCSGFLGIINHKYPLY